MKNKTILWSIITFVIIGSIFGIIKLASKSQTAGSGSNNAAITISAINDNENIKGDKEAKATLIEYSDFQCPACGSYYPILKKVSEDMEAQVRFAYRHFPLPQHKNAKLAATVAEAAGKQGKFWEMHDLIFSKSIRLVGREKTRRLSSPNTPKICNWIWRNFKPTSLPKK